MDEIDAVAMKIGSGPYCKLADGMKSILDGVDEDKRLAKQEFALQLILDVPACVSATAISEFVNDRHFIQSVMRRKALELQTHDPLCAGVLGQAWKIDMVDAMTPYDDADDLGKLRVGIMNLFVSRSGFLTQIVNRLNHLEISPRMLCPFDMGALPVGGDDGLGPTASDFLFCEPRMLRWLLGMGELEPWPKIGKHRNHIRELITVANKEGGDDIKVNQPCQCQSCAGVRIPTMETNGGLIFSSAGPGVSLTPSEYDSDTDDAMLMDVVNS